MFEEDDDDDDVIEDEGEEDDCMLAYEAGCWIKLCANGEDAAGDPDDHIIWWWTWFMPFDDDTCVSLLFEKVGELKWCWRPKTFDGWLKPDIICKWFWMKEFVFGFLDSVGGGEFEGGGDTDNKFVFLLEGLSLGDTDEEDDVDEEEDIESIRFLLANWVFTMSKPSGIFDWFLLLLLPLIKSSMLNPDDFLLFLAEAIAGLISLLATVNTFNSAGVEASKLSLFDDDNEDDDADEGDIEDIF